MAHRGRGAIIFTVHVQTHFLYGERLFYVAEEPDETLVALWREHSRERMVVPRSLIIPCRADDDSVGIARALGRNIREMRL